MEQLAREILAFQVALLFCFVFFAFFNYLYGFASLKKPRLRRVPLSGRTVAVVIVSYNERYVLPATVAACDSLTYPNRITVLADDSDDPEIVESLRRLAVSRGCEQVSLSLPMPHDSCKFADEPLTPIEIWESSRFVYLHRHSNQGFKGGNLREVSKYLRYRVRLPPRLRQPVKTLFAVR